MKTTPLITNGISFKKPTLLDKIKMYFGWGEYAYLPQDLGVQIPEGSVKVSQPYIITIENTGKVEHEAVILGKHKYLNLKNHGNHKDIVLSTVISDTNYTQLVNNITDRVTEISDVYLQTQSASQIHKTLNLSASNANGNKIDYEIIPLLDPYQQLCTTVRCKKLFSIDGYLDIKTKILPGQKLAIYLYPISKGTDISSFDSLASLIGYERKK